MLNFLSISSKYNLHITLLAFYGPCLLRSDRPWAIKLLYFNCFILWFWYMICYTFFQQFMKVLYFVSFGVFVMLFTRTSPKYNFKFMQIKLQTVGASIITCPILLTLISNHLSFGFSNKAECFLQFNPTCCEQW